MESNNSTWGMGEKKEGVVSKLLISNYPFNFRVVYFIKVIYLKSLSPINLVIII